ARTSGLCWNRLPRSPTRENSSGKILMATSRLSFVSRARYTSPIPPLPSKAVISCEPSRMPIVKAMISEGIIEQRGPVDVNPIPESDTYATTQQVKRSRLGERFGVYGGNPDIRRHRMLAYNIVVVRGGRLLGLLERAAVGGLHGPSLAAVGTIFQGMPADRDLVARLYAAHFPALSSDHADGTHFKRPLHATASSGIDRDDVQPRMWITPFEFLQCARDGNH